MITLVRLRADQFKGLRALDITFPERGAILIEGRNEAGKSTLFEAVYFALYGAGLTGEDGKPKLEELIAFGEQSAWVELTCAIDMTHLSVRRDLRRDRRGQTAKLTIMRPGAADETVNGISAVNERILREMGNLDGDTLRNSCFVEQKELGRLESLDRNAREIAIERLLGLARLSKLEKSFQTSKSDAGKQLADAEPRRDLVRAWDDALTAQRDYLDLDADLTALSFLDTLDQITALDARRLSLRGEAERDDAARQLIAERLSRADQITTLLQSTAPLDTQITQIRQTRQNIGLSTEERATRRAEVQSAIPQAEERDRVIAQAQSAVERRDSLEQWQRLAGAANQSQTLTDEETQKRDANAAAQQLMNRAKNTTERMILLFLGISAAILLPGLIASLSTRQGVYILFGLVLMGISFFITVAPTLQRFRLARVLAAVSEQKLREATSRVEVAQQVGADPALFAVPREALARLNIAPESVTPALVESARQEARSALSAAGFAETTSITTLAEAHAQSGQHLAQLRATAAAFQEGDQGGQGDLDRQIEQAQTRWRAITSSAESLQLTFPEPAQNAVAPEEALLAKLSALLSVARASLSDLDSAQLRARNDALLTARGERETTLQRLDAERPQILESLKVLGSHAEIDFASADLTDRAALEMRWPRLTTVIGHDLAHVKQGAKEASDRALQLNAVAQSRGPQPKELDVAASEEVVATIIRQREVAERAMLVIGKAREQIMRRVLPATERNMCLILPLLTAGRYHDVRLSAEESDGQPGELDYKIRVWDHAARRYVGKAIFSGGARDQCSLALRLAFALATLPQELGVAPGFLFLDEPLSAFDQERASALVELLTNGMIAGQFAQVVVISHQHAYTQSDFPYHLRMERGRVIESDLASSAQPDVATMV